MPAQLINDRMSVYLISNIHFTRIKASYDKKMTSLISVKNQTMHRALQTDSLLVFFAFCISSIIRRRHYAS